jgi:hypothetical protein
VPWAAYAVHFVIIVPVGFGLGWLQLAEMPL